MTTRYLVRVRLAANTLLLVFLTVLAGTAQPSLAGLKKKADTAYDRARYREALAYYRQSGSENTKDKKLRLKIGICLYETNDVDGALRVFQSLINAGKTQADVFFQVARCYEAKTLFAEATSSYKRFLQKAKSDDPRRAWVKDQVFRCANGLRLKYADEKTYVENAGTTINTVYREFGVKNSPTVLDKIYFSSDREDKSLLKPANGNVDIYATILTNGKWSDPAPLPAHINTSGYEEACGFSTNGQILYYLTREGQQWKIRTDTFSREKDQTYKGCFDGPFYASNDGTDLTFFNDSIILFSSDRPGGYGGYDLYISFLEKNRWSKAINLGPAINTFYDERYPFLTRNGLTVFYSSDNLQSIGGYDIFSCAFDPLKKTWSAAENLGFPVNSAGNETYMIISPDGMTAYLSSDRKDGYGAEDIYRVFFKQPLQAHQEISELPTFQQFITSGEAKRNPVETPAKPAEVKEYFISHLFFEDASDILTPQNTKKLDLLANLMLIYPTITAELSCFEIPSGQRTYSVYYSIKKSEEAAAYLVRKGVARGRLILKGYGSSFPIAAMPPGMQAHPLFNRLNQRLEITPHGYAGEPVSIHIENIQVPENMQNEAGLKFTSLRHGFYYTVQLTSITQILQNTNLESLQELFIEMDNANGQYQYMTGMLTTYEDARVLLDQVLVAGFREARIVPYIDGIRIQPDALAKWAATYPDLQEYIRNLH